MSFCQGHISNYLASVQSHNRIAAVVKVEYIAGGIKDGIVYDARQLLADVAEMVSKQKAERGISRLPEIEFPTGRP